MSKSYWQAVSVHSEASQKAVLSWLNGLADGMTVERADIMCDRATDRELKLRVFVTGKEGQRRKFTRSKSVRGEYTITMEAIPSALKEKP